MIAALAINQMGIVRGGVTGVPNLYLSRGIPEGVSLCLEVADGEGVPWLHLVLAFLFFDSVFDGLADAAPALLFCLAMMAGR